MHDRELYRQILGIQPPWEVSEVDVDLPGTGVTVHIRHSGADLACPQCGESCSGARSSQAGSVSSRCACKMLYHYVLIGPYTTMAAVLKPRQREFPAGLLDRIGIGISAFCLLQCLALPLALIFAPVASFGMFSHAVFHLVLLAVIVPVSLLAFGLGFMQHRNVRMWVPAGIGLALLALAAVLEQNHVIGPGWIAMVTSMGGLGLIIGHWLNMRSREG